MIKDQTIAVIVPAHQEQNLITVTLASIPEYVDSIIVINDGSTDQTETRINEACEQDSRITLINHEVNKGLGQTLITGYLAAREGGYDVVAVMAGDNQMDPDDLITVISPILDKQAFYVKGNRFSHPDVFSKMPKVRLIGNAFLTIVTKFATGFWHTIDPQCGYTAISKIALKTIPINQMIKGYGYNAHILYMLNIFRFKVADVRVRPVYATEKSGIKLGHYMLTVSWLLIRLFCARIARKYIVQEFHPISLFYLLGLIQTVAIGMPIGIKALGFYLSNGYFHEVTLLFVLFAFSFGLMCLFFAMWLDIEANQELNVQVDNWQDLYSVENPTDSN